VQHDPHDAQPRLAPFRKDDGDEAFFSALNRVLATAELPSRKRSDLDPATLPIVYVVGTPRSGTTLLSQLLSRYLPVGYINNLIARFWQRPSVGIRISAALLGESGRDKIAFDSLHGVTPGIEGPHEFGYFWRQWLRLDMAATHKLSATEAASVDVAGLRRALEQEILSEFAAPVVFKNAICGFQAELLSQVHPASLFIWIQRDTAEVTRSILRSRMERYGRYDAWWSLKPAGFPQLRELASPVQQVLGQVADCHDEFARALVLPGVRWLTVDYANLIQQPERVLEQVCDALAVMGHALSPLQHGRSGLRALRRPANILLANELERELASSLAALPNRTS
jgi:LPS sulfotransferase NodH